MVNDEAVHHERTWRRAAMRQTGAI